MFGFLATKREGSCSNFKGILPHGAHRVKRVLNFLIPQYGSGYLAVNSRTR
jgi:hypothetical protein